MTDADANAVTGLAVDDVFERDNDSLYVMPLQIVPFESPALRRGRLIKNATLKPAIELYQHDDGTSGQILIEDITPSLGTSIFGWRSDKPSPDLKLLHDLGRLTSYDVFSLRIFFRDLKIPITSVDYLTLSDNMKLQLDSYMQTFTQPLVTHIFGHDVDESYGADGIINLFRNPDTTRALENLQKLASVLDLPIEKIPSFLEDFADLYLSFTYYQKFLDDIVPKMVDLVAEINDLKENHQMRQDRNLMDASRELVADLTDLTSSTTGRFEKFYNISEKMWEDISAEKFRETEKIVRSYHTTIGGVLCGLGIKMNAWKKRFPSRDIGSPQARAETLLSSMMPGMQKIKALDRDAPMTASHPAQAAEAP